MKYFSIMVIVLAAFLLIGCGSSKPTDYVEKAYELRMEGKLDQAEKLLNEYLQNNYKDSKAHFELARLFYHKGLGDPRNLQKAAKDARREINIALTFDSTNVTYAIIATRIIFIQAYYYLRGDTKKAPVFFKSLLEMYDKILKLRPDFHEALLYETEINYALPEFAGCDTAKALEEAAQLEKIDEILGAKARLLVTPRDSIDAIAYWKNMLAKYPDNLSLKEELGKAYLMKDSVDQGMKILKDVAKEDENYSYLYLDLARYFMMKTMRTGADRDFLFKNAEEALNDYLDTDPDRCMRAFATDILARVKSGQGDDEKSKELYAQAEELDPYHSKAFGTPPAELFAPLDKVVWYHTYLFRPY